jgi:peptidyl-prolyl isomerase E (cyclophilin E)
MAIRRKMVYVGGLEQSVTEEVLHAAFIPFGNIREVSIPKDFKESKYHFYFYVYGICFLFKYLVHSHKLNTNTTTIFYTDKHRGFGFVDFEEEEDATAAIDNMNGAEILGRTLKCNLAKPDTKLTHGKAVWSAEEWIQKSLKDGDAPTEEVPQEE